MSTKAATQATQATTKAAKPRYKTPNFFDICFKLQNFGVGRLFRRSHWPEDSYLRLVKFVPTTNSIAGHNRGKATVLKIWKGEVAKKPIIMNGPLKRIWKLVDHEEQEAFIKKFSRSSDS
eukprot:TRINITY_DN2956_c0_g1_i2.p1 TRINITY_DN2956_c0_g1~~TRINITY_DN2956_c0_g1_i2.p1  ORF type:complete len:120 (-),score=23.68 TRINITY_DN2956_c0_g1_i2:169-528(-)